MQFNTTGSHIVFAYALVRAIEQKKLDLLTKSKKSPSSLTTEEDEQIKFFRKRGAIYLFASAISACIEIFTGKKVSNVFRISFGDKVSTNEASRIWNEVIDACIPLCLQLEDALNDGLKNAKQVDLVIQKYRGLISVTAKTKYKYI